MSRTNVLIWSSRALIALVVVIASVIAGGEFRASRDAAAAHGKASASPSAVAASPTPAVAPTPAPTMSPFYSATASPIPTPSPSQAPAVTVSPGGAPTSTAAQATWISGRVTLPGGGSVKNIQIRVYRADGFANGPTPVPPEVAQTVAGFDGVYKITLPAGSYKVGAFVNESISQTLRCWWVTWYGDAYAIGLGKVVAVNGGTSDIDISMLPAYRVSGQITGRDGVGVPHASIRTAYGGNVEYPIANATTDDAGRFSFRTVPMKVTLYVETAGVHGIVGTSSPLDVRGDLGGLRYTVDRGNILSGTLRDGSGRALAETNFSVLMVDPTVLCGGSCNATTDGAGHFALVVPTATIRFQTWPKSPVDPMLVSADYAISSDKVLDPVVVKQ